ATDAKGSFLLLNVPAGVTSLHITGTGVDATLRMPAATILQERRGMSVSVTDHDAEEHHEESEDEIRGTISDLQPPSLKVGGRPWTPTTDTKITLSGASVALTALTNGDFAEVEGALQADGTLLARTIAAHPPRTDGGHDDGDDDHELASFVGLLTAETD